MADKKKIHDWFLEELRNMQLGSMYEERAVKDHKYFVEIKSKHLIRKIKEYYGNVVDLKCLDLGCGTAETIEHYNKEIKYTVGCDYSFGMLSFGLKKGLEKVFFINSLSEELPFKNASFNVVVLYGILHHIDSMEKISQMISEAYRVLHVNGMIGIYDFNPINPVSRYIVKTCEIDKAVKLDGHKSLQYPSTFYAWETREILKKIGFRIWKNEYLIFFPRLFRLFSPLEKVFSQIQIGGMYAIFGVR